MSLREDGTADVEYRIPITSRKWKRATSFFCKLHPPPSTLGGRNLKLQIVAGDVAGKLGVGVTVGYVTVRDLDLHWQTRYPFVTTKAGLQGGVSAVPDTTDWHSVGLAGGCPNWAGSEISLYSRGAQAAIIEVGSKLEFGIALPNGESVHIEEESWFNFTWPAAGVDVSSFGVGKLGDPVLSKPYLGS
ncbi:MAG: hypothetical protein FJ290_05110 [Planctomycetes bacterium]|nr:hypothetical protein [Planctomycetota bacterium]